MMRHRIQSEDIPPIACGVIDPAAGGVISRDADGQAEAFGAGHIPDPGVLWPHDSAGVQVADELADPALQSPVDPLLSDRGVFEGRRWSGCIKVDHLPNLSESA